MVTDDATAGARRKPNLQRQGPSPSGGASEDQINAYDRTVQCHRWSDAKVHPWLTMSQGSTPINALSCSSKSFINSRVDLGRIYGSVQPVFRYDKPVI